jgi:hypothetical protein
MSQKRTLPVSPTKNKLAKVGVSFAPQNMSVKIPHSPHITPQLHHDFTTGKHDKKPKPPAKVEILACKFFLPKD